MTISLTHDARKQSIASIKRYFSDELDQDIGELKAGLLLDFVLKALPCSSCRSSTTESPSCGSRSPAMAPVA